MDYWELELTTMEGREPDQSGPSEPLFDLSGGRLCIDFTNTVDARGSAQPRERLERYADLVAWSHQGGNLSPDQAGQLRAEAARRPDDAAAVLARARALREAIYRLFSAVTGNAPPSTADLATLNAELATALARARIVPEPDGFGWGWADHEAALDSPLWPVARSAAEVLTGDDRRALRVCAWDSCGWLFADTSKNRSRQWCDMRVCGNRAKARRHYERKKAAAQRPPRT